MGLPVRAFPRGGTRCDSPPKNGLPGGTRDEAAGVLPPQVLLRRALGELTHEPPKAK